MSERKYLRELTKQIKATCPGVTWEKLGDTFGGHKRLDVFAFWRGHGFIIEFKMQAEGVEGEQLKKLKEASGAANCFVGSFFMPEGARHVRAVRFHPVGPLGVDYDTEYILHWESGKYAGLPSLMPALLLVGYVNK